MSFSRLSNRICAEVGGLHDKVLDKGGRLLMMHRALEEVSSELKVYVLAGRKTEFLENLLAAYDEFKASCVDRQMLYRLADFLPELFRDKIRDLVTIFEAYEAMKPEDVFDPRERFDRLAEGIARAQLGTGAHLYVDGFTDFTEQEILVLEEFLKKGSEVTLCLTCGGLDDEEDIFELPRCV